jgi:hypothetical protein
VFAVLFQVVFDGGVSVATASNAFGAAVTTLSMSVPSRVDKADWPEAASGLRHLIAGAKVRAISPG